ncbi:YgfZ/GcvT domain-containing protein [Tundrisphaera sp. TA3]|uniref:CAF17-like 4Fe-4S cluster assembly/insertion protein YgfZ n=1 Tax=Tundrisphaera sp. TA3 TaxID=3435775 RepID=UPI003EBB98AD
MTTPAASRPESGWIDRSDRVRIEVQGPDRAKFLHNLVTNDIKKLVEGQGCEAFITTPQGKTLAYVALSALKASTLLRSDVGESTVFLGHLQKYSIFDDVAIEEITDQTFEIHAFGRLAEDIVHDAKLDGLANADQSIAEAEWAGHSLRFVREAPAGVPGLTLIGPLAAADSVRTALGRASGTASLDPAVFEAMRIEAGTPISGRDVTPNNLPQEVGRDRATISFVKGCYLGQETVARLDALGHVNKILKGLRIEGSTPPAPGASLVGADGKAAGTVTSAAPAIGGGAVVGLAYVRVAHANPGTSLAVEVGGQTVAAVVADLPMTPPAGG